MATQNDPTPTDGETRYKIVVGTVLAIALGVVLVWLQGAFDQGDRRRAVETVELHQIRPGTPTFGSWLVAEGGGPVDWEATLLSGCRGIVRVSASLADARRAVFRVDLVTRTFEPENPVATELLEAYRAPPEDPVPDAPAEGGQPPDPAGVSDIDVPPGD